MNSVWNFIRNSKALLVVLIVVECIVPVLTIAVFSGGDLVSIFTLMNCYWLGFYGSILLCCTKCPMVLKIILPAVNLIFFLGVMFISLMGGAEVISGMLLKMALPFAPNPWIN